MTKEKGDIWSCKIGSTTKPLPPGSDLPMREAVRRAYRELTGEWPDFLFSGWGAELDDAQRLVVVSDEMTRESLKEILCAPASDSADSPQDFPQEYDHGDPVG